MTYSQSSVLKSWLLLLAVGLAPVITHAEGLRRAGFSNSYPTNFNDWANGYFGGDGKLGMIVFCDPLNDRVIYNDRGFNMAKTSNRSFAQVSAADIETIRSNCASRQFCRGQQAGRQLGAISRRWRRRAPSRL